MISASDRENAIQLIEEAVQSGAELRKACERLGDHRAHLLQSEETATEKRDC